MRWIKRIVTALILITVFYWSLLFRVENTSEVPFYLARGQLIGLDGYSLCLWGWVEFIAKFNFGCKTKSATVNRETST